MRRDELINYKILTIKEIEIKLNNPDEQLRGGCPPPNPLFFYAHLVENLKLHISSNFY